MLSVEAAWEHLAAQLGVVGTESVSLSAAAGRVLRRPIIAGRMQPPVAVSAMDGYAVRANEAEQGASLRLEATIAAGERPGAAINRGGCARIFTGAPVPIGANAIVLQEDADQRPDGSVLVGRTTAVGEWIRKAGQDFLPDAVLLDEPRRLKPQDIALAAADGRAWLDVARKPRVALIAIGDELRHPGEPTPPGCIYSSNQFGVAAMAEAAGAMVETPPIVPDNLEILTETFRSLMSADIVVTLGGASEGNHDLVRPALGALGAEMSFYKIAMRPGKPLSVAKSDGTVFLSLPGNPVSSMVCARLFLIPAINALCGLPPKLEATQKGVLAESLGEPNGPRAHYMRAFLTIESGVSTLRPFRRQDSALLTVMANAGALAIRPPHDPPRATGKPIEFLVL